MRIWPHVMCDVECAGTARDAALMAIGAACFDMATMEVGPTFVVPVHVASSVEIGMRIYPSAFLWWLRQSEEARKAVAYNLVHISVAMEQLTAFMTENTRKQDVRVWANSSAFDMSILNFAYDRLGQEMPWNFGRETCFRTVRNMNSRIEFDHTKRENVHHNALDDSLFQIEHLFKIKRYNDEHPRAG